MNRPIPGRTTHKPKSYIDAVIRFINHKDIVLTPDQEQFMQRLQFADELIRSRKYVRQQIINQIAARFQVSDWRADQDITDTHRVFGASRKINKAYLLSFHLDDIQEQINLAKQARRIELLPKLNDNYTYALNSLPAEEKESDSAPAKIIFVIKDKADNQRDIDTILAEAENLIKQNHTDEYIQFEE